MEVRVGSVSPPAHICSYSVSVMLQALLALLEIKGENAGQGPVVNAGTTDSPFQSGEWGVGILSSQLREGRSGLWGASHC